jgi:hypothetical protein
LKTFSEDIEIARRPFITRMALVRRLSKFFGSGACHLVVEAVKIVRNLGAETAGVPACPRRT